jgi:hypothetical protein
MVEQLADALDSLAATDVAGLDDVVLRDQLLHLLIAGNRVQAELARRVDVFERRGLYEESGFRTTRAWLMAFGRVGAGLAGRLVKAARLLRRLPKVAVAAQSGEVTSEHVQQVAQLAERVGAAEIESVEAVLADAARVLAPPEWCDGHHLKPWAEQGETTADGCLLLCRHHHVLVHEGGWGIRLDPNTGDVNVTRPGGIRYELNRGRTTSWSGPTSQIE